MLIVTLLGIGLGLIFVLGFGLCFGVRLLMVGFSWFAFLPPDVQIVDSVNDF